MSIHSRAFDKMNMLIFGKDPMVPMELEQTFAKAKPSDEIFFDSYEDYDQAFDFTKENKNVGLVFLLENCGGTDVSSILNQFIGLATDQETCYGVLIHSGVESIKGLRAIKENENFIAYYDVNDLLDQDKAKYLLNEIWEKYQSEFVKKIIPQALEATFRGLTLAHISEEHLVFKQRLCSLLGNEMNISWKENLILKWHPILEVIREYDTKILSANKTLNSLYHTAIPNLATQDLTSLAQMEIGIAHKVGNATTLLYQAYKNNNIEQFLDSNLSQVTPRSKALLRAIKRHQNKILEIARSTGSQINLGVLKAV